MFSNHDCRQTTDYLGAVWAYQLHQPECSDEIQPLDRRRMRNRPSKMDPRITEINGHLSLCLLVTLQRLGHFCRGPGKITNGCSR